MLDVEVERENTLKSLDKISKDLENRLPTKLETIGVFLEGKMVEKISSGLQPELKKATIARKGSSTPLIDKGELIGQIDHKVSSDAVEVGVFGSRASKAKIHEFGAQRANIPERSFMRSSFNENKRQIKKIIKSSRY